jgi:hypothetical protein
LLFYQVAFCPLLGYAVALHHGFQGSFWQFLSLYLDNLDSFGDGPLWFAGALLVFSTLYALWRLAAVRASAPGQTTGTAPRNAVIALFALVLASPLNAR